MRTIRSSKSSEFDSPKPALVLGVNVGDRARPETRSRVSANASGQINAFLALPISARQASGAELALVVVEIVEDLFDELALVGSSMIAKLRAMPMR